MEIVISLSYVGLDITYYTGREHRKSWLYSRRTVKEFWKYVGNIGMGSERHSKVPWQVIMTDGSISKDR